MGPAFQGEATGAPQSKLSELEKLSRSSTQGVHFIIIYLSDPLEIPSRSSHRRFINNDAGDWRESTVRSLGSISNMAYGPI